VREQENPRTEREVYVNPEEIRSFISSLVGVAQVASSLTAYLDGENKWDQDIWLTSRDLGDFEPFCRQWAELCSWRQQEVREVSRILWLTCRKLAHGLAKYLDTDVEVAGTFPAADGTPSLDRQVARYGLEFYDHRSGVTGVHDAPPPSAERDKRMSERY
jgi:hypothetical protein